MVLDGQRSLLEANILGVHIQTDQLKALLWKTRNSQRLHMFTLLEMSSFLRVPVNLEMSHSK